MACLCVLGWIGSVGVHIWVCELGCVWNLLACGVERVIDLAVLTYCGSCTVCLPKGVSLQLLLWAAEAWN